MNRTLAISTTLALAALAGTTLVLWPRPQWWSDADSIRTPTRHAPVREILWQPAGPLRPLPDHDEYEPRVSADGTLMVLVRGRPGHNADLFTSRWSPKGWSTPEPLAAVNTDHDELGPELSADGQRLYFYSDRPGGLGGYDLWVSSRSDNAWGGPVNLGPSINSPWNEYGPALTPTGDRLYFASNRPRPDEPPSSPETWSATVRERRTRHDYDLFAAPLSPDSATPTAPAAPLAALNTPADESSPAVSPAGDFLYFASDRSEGQGGYDLYRARLARDASLGPAANLGDAVNSTHNDLDPALSAAGFRLTFSSDRPSPTPTNETATPPTPASSAQSPASTPLYSLWTSTSREVFLETGPLAVPTFGPFWPRLLLLLAALLPLLLLSKLLLGNSSWRSRLGRMNLLAQCIILSLFLHAILASLLAVWKVGSGIVDLMRSGGGTGTRVILASSSPSTSSGSIAAQIRGALTDAALALPELNAEAPAPLTLPEHSDPAPLSDLPLPALALAAPAAIDTPAPRRADSITPSQPAPTPVAPTATTTALPRPAAPAAASKESGPTQPTLTQTPSAPLPVPSATGDTSTTHSPLPALGPVPAATPLAAETPTPRRSTTGPVTPTTALLPAAGGPSAAAPLPSTPSAAAPTAEAAPTSPLSLGASNSPAAPLPTATQSGAGGPQIAHATLPALAPPANPGAALAAPLPTAARGESSISPTSPAAPAPATLSSNGAGPALPTPIAPAASSGSAEEPAASPSSLGSLPASSPAAPAAPVPGLRSPDPAATPGTTALPAIATPRAPAGSSLDLDATPRRTSGSTPGDTPTSTPSLPASGLTPDAALPIPKETFDQRRPESRQQLLERMGGSAETEKAVGLALEWFKRHQAPDGRWSSRHFDDQCGRCSGQAEVDADVGMTGLTLLCFLGAGHTHTQDGPYRAEVDRALHWLLARQNADGDLRGRETMYSQTVATVALCEAYAMTRDPALASPARKAVDLVLRRAASASPDKRDTSVLGWLVFTVESARRAGLDVPQDVFQRATAWLDQTSDPRATGLYTYGPGQAPSAPMTAEAMFVQQLLGHARTEPRMDASARFIATSLPSWDAAAPTHHWYYATLALFQHQGDAWQSWNTALKRELLAHQHPQGPDAGSWDPQDEWSRLVGRVYQTAVCTLSLEVYYRYRTAPTPKGPSPTPAP